MPARTGKPKAPAQSDGASQEGTSTSARQFESLLEAVPDAMVGVDQAGAIRFVNRQTELLFGYDRADLVGQPIETLVPESLQQVHTGLREGYVAAPRTRAMGADLELSGRQADGTVFPVDVSLSHIDAEDGALVIATVRDMTDRKKAEEECRRSDRLTALIEFSGEAIISITLDGIVTSWNPAAERLLGYSSEEIIGTSGRVLSPEDRTDEMSVILATIRAGQHVEHLETACVRKDGTVITVSLTVSPVCDAAGALIGVSTIAHDVTKQKESFESARNLTAIVNDSDDAIIGKTLDNIVTSWNPAAERMYGYSSEEIIGKSCGLLCPVDRSNEACAALARIRDGQHVEHFETIRVRRDGTLFPVSISISPVCDADGTIIGATTITRDMSKQKQAFESARSMIESSLDSLVSISPEGKITDVNEATVKVTGVPRETLIGTAFSDYFTDPDKANEGYQRVFAQGSVTDYPLTMRHRDGALIDVLYNASVYRNAGGNVLGVFAAARDVTEQKQAQAEIAQQAKELDRLAELERFQRLTVGRELKMIELKKEIEYLRMLGPTQKGEPDDKH